ncbi:aldehyde dehydrogenase family protein [Tatumella sp. TA1]|nr:aldehyde dehydrogenase family protein [Tatumella sp. TA1]
MQIIFFQNGWDHHYVEAGGPGSPNFHKSNAFADHTRLSINYMNRLLAEEGLSLMKLVWQLRLEESRRLLQKPLDNRLQLAEIAGSAVLAANQVIPVSLELGGKAPFIVLADADIEKAAQDAIDARMANCGQVCICNERTYVQREAYEPFMRALKKAAEAIVVGDPLAKKTTMGPKVSPAEKEHVEELLAKTQQEGGKIFWQGSIPSDEKFKGGNWVAPTIVTDLPATATILKEEAFGPILPVVVFDTIDEVVGLANDCEYGLSSYLYTRDLIAAMQISDALEYGEVYINRYGPEEINGFHAGWKLSGIGGDDGEHGYQIYVKQKTVYLNYQS